MKGPLVPEPDFDAMRRAMVASQLRANAVDDPRVVAAMAAAPRESFVPAGMAALAYADTMLPLGSGRTMNLPMATGRLINEAMPDPRDHVLVIGAGTGYAAALLSRLAASVIALEEDARLAAEARAALGAFANVKIAEGPLAAGWQARAPYDVVLIDGAVEHVPDAIVAQLAEGGRLAGALIERGVCRLVRGSKQGGAFGLTAFAEAEAAPLAGFARAAEFVF